MHPRLSSRRIGRFVAVSLSLVLVLSVLLTPGASPAQAAGKGTLGSSNSAKKNSSQQKTASKKKPTKKKAAAKKSSKPKAVAKKTVKRPKAAIKASAPKAQIVGKKATVSVTTSHAPARSEIRLERRSGSRWIPVSTKKKPAHSAKVAFRVKTAAGNQLFRARLVTGKKVIATTTTLTVTGVYGCSAGSAPSHALSYTSNDPVKHTGRAIVAPLTQAICAASKRSTITVGVFIIDLGSTEARPIFRALEYQARMRDVKVRFLLESQSGGASPATIAALRKWSKVSVCSNGCTNFNRSVSSINHTKFTAISDTTWSKAKRPYVWYSSANFSNRQLTQYWQNATAVYGDQKAYATTIAAYDKLARCSTGRAACAKAGLSPSSDGKTFGFSQPRLPSTPGVSVSTDLFPKVDGHDPIVELLKSTTCAGHRNGKVYLASYLWAASRAKRVSDEVKRLKASGCDVRIIYSQSGLFVSSPASLQILRASGAEQRSRDLMHIKALQLSGVRFNGMNHRYLYYGGNQNTTYSGLRTNNENMLLVSAPMSGNSSGATTFRSRALTNWDRIWATQSGNR